MSCTIYVQAASKKAINSALIQGVVVVGKVYDMGGHTKMRSVDWPENAVIKVYEREVMGSPYAKAYGTVKRNRNGMVQVK